MPRWELEIQVLPPFRHRVTNRWLRSVVQYTLDNEKREQFGLIGLTIAGDEMLHRLNRDYGGIDEITDVLAFGSEQLPQKAVFRENRTGEPSSEPINFITPASAPTILGDVVISYPQATLQAKQRKHTIRQEIALLVAHGILHLLGYDHVMPEQKREMWARQDKVVEQILKEAKP